jgi:hypothetical protein
MLRADLDQGLNNTPDKARSHGEGRGLKPVALPADRKSNRTAKQDGMI